MLKMPGKIWRFCGETSVVLFVVLQDCTNVLTALWCTFGQTTVVVQSVVTAVIDIDSTPGVLVSSIMIAVCRVLWCVVAYPRCMCVINTIVCYGTPLEVLEVSSIQVLFFFVWSSQRHTDTAIIVVERWWSFYEMTRWKKKHGQSVISDRKVPRSSIISILLYLVEVYFHKNSRRALLCNSSSSSIIVIVVLIVVVVRCYRYFNCCSSTINCLCFWNRSFLSSSTLSRLLIVPCCFFLPTEESTIYTLLLYCISNWCSPVQ